MKKLLIITIVLICTSIFSGSRAVFAKPIESELGQDFAFGVVLLLTKAPSNDIVVLNMTIDTPFE